MLPWLRLRRPRIVGLNDVNPETEQAHESWETPESRAESQSESQDRKGEEEYYPSINDVLCVREFLLHFQLRKVCQHEGEERKGKGDVATPGHTERLPVEIIDMILDHAEYWPSVETKIEAKRVIRQDQDAEILRTGGLCYASSSPAIKPRILPHRTVHPCRKIVFTLTAHDQGWGGSHGTRSAYEGSYSWFDAYRIPAFHPLSDDNQHQPADLVAQYQQYYEEQRPRFEVSANFLPSKETLCCNKVAVRQAQTRRISWHYRDALDPNSDEAKEIGAKQGRGPGTTSGQMVRAMEIGDELSVWARARFPGWMNHVEGMSVRVFWAV
ncbi:hypothetical protein DIZ76_010218 [Coccidioides immitis]|nr:hypothetical protein DIZ76_010218 [Coccidioides immitis]